MGKWKVTPEKESHERSRITTAQSFSGTPGEESKNGSEADQEAFFRSRSLSFSSPRMPNIGSSWTEFIIVLRHSGSIFEAVNCLRNIEDILRHIPRTDRLAYCKDDFESAMAMVRTKIGLDSSNLTREYARIMKSYFDEDKINKLPEVILQQIFSYHQPHKLVDLMTTCKDWTRLGLSKPLWQDLYIQRFIPPSLVAAVAAAAEEGEEEGDAEDTVRPVIHVSVTDLRKSTDCAQLYRSRILVPLVMDKVEVMWKGKFRLDDNAIYSGLGWWTAEVLSHRDKQIKIRYPGWSERWEEWVPRNKIRLAIGGDHDAVIKTNDIVEVWCSGQFVPGVWLLCQVKKIKRGKYGFDNVCSTGMMWVDRSHVRPAEFSSFSRNHVKFVGSSTERPNTNRWGSPIVNRCTIS